MKSLVERIKQECATAYYALKSFGFKEGHIKVYGCTPDESDVLNYLCCYHENHYSRYNIFLPRDFRRLMHNKSGRRQVSLEKKEFFVFHYRVNLKAMKKKAKRIELWDPDFNAETWMNNFYERFNPATVIWSFSGDNAFVPNIIGRKTLQQEIMNYIKVNPENLFELFNEISAVPSSIPRIQKETKEVHIYDLLNKPKEVHFDLKV